MQELLPAGNPGRPCKAIASLVLGVNHFYPVYNQLLCGEINTLIHIGGSGAGGFADTDCDFLLSLPVGCCHIKQLIRQLHRKHGIVLARLLCHHPQLVCGSCRFGWGGRAQQIDRLVIDRSAMERISVRKSICKEHGLSGQSCLQRRQIGIGDRLGPGICYSAGVVGDDVKDGSRTLLQQLFG
ncbi:hypothetical protein D3C85_1345510 [compost metagenome]